MNPTVSNFRKSDLTAAWRVEAIAATEPSQVSLEEEQSHHNMEKQCSIICTIRHPDGEMSRAFYRWRENRAAASSSSTSGCMSDWLARRTLVPLSCRELVL